ncbi:MAG: methionine--tRNA ligase [Microscillaceae bacterium]
MNTHHYLRHTITAALPYANGPVHIGHLAGVYVPADIYVRYLRQIGEEVLFVCGSDEHGVPVTIRADKEGLSVQEVVDKYHQLIHAAFARFGISFDIYSRTSLPVHHQTAQDFFKVLHDKGVFRLQESAQFYDEKAGQFLADRLIKGTCPVCSFPDAYGDQCENCGSTLSPDDLIQPRSTLSEAPLVKKLTRHWYLPLNEYEAWLREWILEGHAQDWKTNVYGQCKSWIDQGLQPRAMTRDLHWGVPVPLPEAEGKVLYVWFDAPIGYISATKDYFAQKGEDPEKWRAYWQDPQTRLVHFIGKDNIVFHCIIFPVLLHAHGDFIVPENVPANEFMNLEDQKISTSRNWAVWLHEYLEDFPGQEDVLRYVLTANAPETKDSVFTWKDFQTRNNSELADILGNFVRRPLALTEKYYGGQVPARAEMTEEDKDLVQQLANFPTRIGEAIRQYRFREGQTLMMDLARLGNQYLQKTAPWELHKADAKGNADRIATILNLSLQVVANLGVLSEPFLPHTAQKICRMLRLENAAWNQAGQIDLLPPGHPVGKAEILFAKIEDTTVDRQIEKLEANKKAKMEAEKQVEAQKPEITFDDFAKIDLRVATIKAAERVPKTQKLLKLTLDTGLDTRIVVSGIAEYFEPEAIIGQQVCLVANLAPRNMKGIASQGMILMAEGANGQLVFVRPGEALGPGSVVR